jgi:lipoprotein-anchoring transpeptidase ErfK/SrfK
VALFVGIGTIAAVKKMTGKPKSQAVVVEPKKTAPVVASIPEPVKPPPPKKIPMPATQAVKPAPAHHDNTAKDTFPEADRISQLFRTKGEKLPIVETISYTSRVDWLKGRPAWIADYAAHFATSRHFIARSLNGKADYFTQKVSTASKFNVFRRDKEIQFYLLVDVTLAKMGLYYLDIGTNERVHLKTYNVGLGKKNPQLPSGSLTPLGTYSLGSKIAVYKPGVNGQYMNKSTEMVRVFGTRWIPFEQAFDGCTAAPKGYGLQGAPFIDDSSKQLVENRKTIGSYESDGCIRLLSEDIEELFSIVITKPTFVVIVKDFHEAKLPGEEVQNPTR